MTKFTKVITETVNCPACSDEQVVKEGTNAVFAKCNKKFRGDGMAVGRGMPAFRIGAAIRNFNMGLSYKQIGEGLEAGHEIPEPGKATVFEWVETYTDHVIKELKNHKATTGDVWVADEMMVNVDGEKCGIGT